MLRIVLTGGIGSGKSTVTKIFADLNVPIIDTDQIARDIVQPGKPAYQQIVSHFGQNILQSDQKIDRPKLRLIIFNNPNEKKWLEQLLHPLIMDIAQANLEKLAKQHHPYAIIVIPLFSAVQSKFSFDRLLVVIADKEIRKQRVAARDQVKLTDVDLIMQQQTDPHIYQQQADDIIENNSDLMNLQDSVKKLHHYYLNLSKNKTKR